MVILFLVFSVEAFLMYHLSILFPLLRLEAKPAVPGSARKQPSPRGSWAHGESWGLQPTGNTTVGWSVPA